MTSLHLSLNEKKELRFSGLGTAGYTWKCILDDETKLKVEKTFADRESTATPTGASSDEIFYLTALKKGIVNATFIQSRSWEPATSAIKNENYSIIIS